MRSSSIYNHLFVFAGNNCRQRTERATETIRNCGSLALFGSLLPGPFSANRMLAEATTVQPDDVDVEKLDYKYIETCTNIAELEAIISVLKYDTSARLC